MIEETDFIVLEKDDELLQITRSGQFQNGGLLLDNDADIVLTDTPLEACWSVKVFKVCVRKIEVDRVILDVYLGGTKLGTITLTTNKPCAKVKGSLGGDAGRVDAEICADFAKKEIRAKGKVCSLFVCAKFNARIIKW